ncbi:hypothetical protein [Butyribacter intestini]|uniref:hypothetical protein n=1 Tax=Butyribacter intestini TaxID=1703332 RepID=UPI0022E93D4D|nr:hypothetical protein [Butyribacter intestini]
MLLELLGLLGLKGVANIGCAVDDAKTKRNTTTLDSNGNVTCIGRTGKYYVNGEETYSWTQEDKYGNTHNLTIGVHSGKVYRDSFDERMRQENNKAKEKKVRAIKSGRPTYDKYNPMTQRVMATEVTTDKVIVCFGEFFNKKTKKTSYRKWYLQPGQNKYNCQSPASGDRGIEITEQEYKKLHDDRHDLEGIPSGEVLNELWGTTCFH